MLNTKEHFKQIEMDTIQQEPLFTELTPEAAATVEGGAWYKVSGVNAKSSLNIRYSPSTSSKIIGSLKPKEYFETEDSAKDGFLKLRGRAGWVSVLYASPAE